MAPCRLEHHPTRPPLGVPQTHVRQPSPYPLRRTTPAPARPLPLPLPRNLVQFLGQPLAQTLPLHPPRLGHRLAQRQAAQVQATFPQHAAQPDQLLPVRPRRHLPPQRVRFKRRWRRAPWTHPFTARHLQLAQPHLGALHLARLSRGRNTALLSLRPSHAGTPLRRPRRPAPPRSRATSGTAHF